MRLVLASSSGWASVIAFAAPRKLPFGVSLRFAKSAAAVFWKSLEILLAIVRHAMDGTFLVAHEINLGDVDRDGLHADTQKAMTA